MKQDLVGKRFGMLVVMSKHPEKKKNSRRIQWICQCDCGNERVCITYDLNAGNSISCGCHKKENLIGQKFSHLKVISKSDKTDKWKATFWVCQCDCGNITEVRTGHLKAGSVKTCGCKIDLLRHAIKGKEKPEYRSWLSMKQRCYNKNNKSFVDYGARGITVCERWKNSYKNFYEDMGDKPDENYSLDRINVYEGYSPDNCRWANRLTQNRNTRIDKKSSSGFRGVHWNSGHKRWHAKIGLNYKKINLGYYENLEDAIQARKDGEEKYWKN